MQNWRGKVRAGLPELLSMVNVELQTLAFCLQPFGPTCREYIPQSFAPNGEWSPPLPISHKKFWRVQQPASTNRKSEIKLGQWLGLCWFPSKGGL